MSLEEEFDIEFEDEDVETIKTVGDLVKHIGGIEFEVSPTHPSPVQYGYRSKLTPHYERPCGGNMPVGFIMQGRRTSLVDVPQCPIASKAINDALPAARERIKKSNPRRGGTLLLRDCAEGVCQDNTAIRTERVGGISYQFCAGEFFQNNPHILPELVQYAIGQAKGTRNLVDAYCGVGVFALAAAKDFENVAGVEISSKAIVCANANAKINNIKNCEFLIGKAETIFDGVAKKFDGAETSVIIDPPRAGCDTAFLEQLTAFAPKRIVYVSCGPDTQARDLAYLTTRGYKLERLQPFDLFPQTRHIESVATISKIGYTTGIFERINGMKKCLICARCRYLPFRRVYLESLRQSFRLFRRTARSFTGFRSETRSFC